MEATVPPVEATVPPVEVTSSGSYCTSSRKYLQCMIWQLADQLWWQPLQKTVRSDTSWMLYLGNQTRNQVRKQSSTLQPYTTQNHTVHVCMLIVNLEIGSRNISNQKRVHPRDLKRSKPCLVFTDIKSELKAQSVCIHIDIPKLGWKSVHVWLLPVNSNIRSRRLDLEIILLIFTCFYLSRILTKLVISTSWYTCTLKHLVLPLSRNTNIQLATFQDLRN